LINIQSANAHIDWAAAKKISLSTAGGANITIEGGNITVQCPGKLTVHAASKKFDGPTNLAYDMNKWPKVNFDEEFVIQHQGSGKPMANRKFEIAREDGTVIRGITDGEGKTGLQKSQFLGEIALKFLD
jgi:type VI secretion system secreted protein VgrG